jgi:hypothetical protein
LRVFQEETGIDLRSCRRIFEANDLRGVSGAILHLLKGPEDYEMVRMIDHEIVSGRLTLGKDAPFWASQQYKAAVEGLAGMLGECRPKGPEVTTILPKTE